MKEKQKKLIFIVVGVIIAIVLVLLLVKFIGGKEEQKPENVQNNTSQESDVPNEKYTEVLENGTKINKSQEFNKPKKYKDLEITNIQYSLVNGNSVLLADVRNLGNKTYEQQDLKITIYGENDEVIIETVITIDKIKPGEIKKINAILTADLLNAKDFKVEGK